MLKNKKLEKDMLVLMMAGHILCSGKTGEKNGSLLN